MATDKRLIQLAKTLRQSAPDTSTYEKVLSDLAEAILQQPDKLYLGSLHFKREVYVSLYQQLHSQLMLLIKRAIAKLDSQKSTDREIETTLDNLLLKALAIIAKQHPHNSLPRQVVLNILVKALLSSRRLQRPQGGTSAFPQRLYEDVRNEAIQQVLLEICQKIEQYDPSHEVIAWVNFLIGRRFIDVSNKYYRQGVTQVPRHQKIELHDTPTFQDLDRLLIDQPPQLSMLQRIVEFVEEDPEARFSQEHIRGRPDVTFKSIFLARHKEDRTWEEITRFFEISSISTVSTVYARCLKKFSLYFQKYL